MWSYIDPFVTRHVLCDECNGTLVLSDDDPAEITVYTREGTKFGQHFTKICQNRWCRKRFKYGYTIKNDVKKYDVLTHETRFLIATCETAFSVDFLYECTLHIMHSNATFQALADTYNQFHNFEDDDVSRRNLNSKRLISGHFLYTLLESTSRKNMNPDMTTSKNWLDKVLQENYPLLKTAFSNEACAPHECEVENCEAVMITDGGMKINRYHIFIDIFCIIFYNIFVK